MTEVPSGEPGFSQAAKGDLEVATVCRISKTADVAGTACQPHDQDNDKDGRKYPANAIGTSAGMITAPIITEPATKEQDEKNDYQDQFHCKPLF